MFKVGDKVVRLGEYCDKSFKKDKVYTIGRILKHGHYIELDEMFGIWNAAKFKLVKAYKRALPEWF